MIKVKEFVENTSETTGEVDVQINNFLKDNKVQIIDIKYQVVPNDSDDYSCALLIYKEGK